MTTVLHVVTTVHVAHAVADAAAAAAAARCRVDEAQGSRRAAWKLDAEPITCLTRRRVRLPSAAAGTGHAALRSSSTVSICRGSVLQLVAPRVVQQIEASGVWVLAVTWRVAHQLRRRTVHLAENQYGGRR